MTAKNAIDQQVGMRIRLRRIALGMTVDELAKATNLTAEQVQLFEGGHERVDAARFYRICRKLDVFASYFFGPLIRIDSERVDPADRRIHARIQTDTNATAMVLGALRPVRILNISRSGAMVSNLTAADLGKNLTVSLAGVRRTGTVVWARDRSGGVRFRELLPASTMEALAAQ